MLPISVIQLFIIKKNISDIHNDILPIYTQLSFQISTTSCVAYWALHLRYPQTCLISRMNILDICNSIVTPISDITYNPIVIGGRQVLVPTSKMMSIMYDCIK